MAKRLRNENVDLDGVDMRILRILAEDARTSVAEIARVVGMSAPSVSERIKRLQDNGTIEGYTIRIDPAVRPSDSCRIRIWALCDSRPPGSGS